MAKMSTLLGIPCSADVPAGAPRRRACREPDLHAGHCTDLPGEVRSLSPADSIARCRSGPIRSAALGALDPARVEARQMPPWHIDKTVGIQEFKNDRSLNDLQIATILKWVDQNAPQGDVKDMPH
jgi:hypothetical protein